MGRIDTWDNLYNWNYKYKLVLITNVKCILIYKATIINFIVFYWNKMSSEKLERVKHLKRISSGTPRRAGECEWFGLAPPKVSLWALVVLRWFKS